MKKGLMIATIIIQLFVAVLNSGATRSLAELTAFLLIVALFLERAPRPSSRQTSSL
ncbi:hypothetical protein [Vibrio spartinae]|uniref:O-succinylbenzoic acid--CoA ligase n=1 Tax=Vibrio spartinae TaxID=1918945 RepID=A0A1N6M6U1_9VIBR|nr:hypothetical protein [Vibrio spartinae]QMV13905.1 hypothetical protein Vspart_01150 [Vibrio spartinae]SIO95168.1 hypothetical protein VSP9026_02907 [Vibrio spartinae]